MTLSDDLMQEMIQLYVTIRGHSIVANLMEVYKREKWIKVKKSKALRKSLQQEQH